MSYVYNLRTRNVYSNAEFCTQCAVYFNLFKCLRKENNVRILESVWPYFTELEYILAHLCRLPNESPPYAQRSLLHAQSHLDWFQLFETAQHHKLVPLLDDGLRQEPSFRETLTQMWGPLPKELKSAIQKNTRLSWLQSNIRQMALRDIQHNFGQRNVDFLLFKGMSYLYTLYPDPAMRPMDDIDLIVRPSDEHQACLALEHSGFKRVDAPHPNSLLFHHPEKKLYLDLHLHISSPSMSSIPVETLFADAHELEQGILIPSALHQILLHIHHQCKEQLHASSIKLRTFIELKGLLSQHDLVWDSLFHCAERWQIRKFVDCSLWCLNALYPGWLPAHIISTSPLREWTTRLVRQPSTSTEAQTSLHVAQRLLFLFANIDTWPNRFGYAKARMQYPIQFVQKHKKKWKSVFSNRPVT